MAKQKRKKTRTHVNHGAGRRDKDAGLTPGAPKSFVISAASHRLPQSLRTLVAETRRVMEPNTASRLRERRKNKLRDFVAMCGPLGVSHLLVFGQTKVGTYGGGGNINLRIMRAPRGPTATFRVNKYALSSDLARARRRPQSVGSEFQAPPLLVLNNFTSDQKHVKVLVTIFQNLFPAIQVHNMRVSSARRIVLLNYNAATDTIDWRHYLITLRPVGVSKTVRRAIEGTSARALLGSSDGSKAGSGSSGTGTRSAKRLVDLSSADDIAEYVLGRHRGLGSSGSSSGRGQSPAASSAAYDSETEADTDVSDAEDERAIAPSSSSLGAGADDAGAGGAGTGQRAVRLREIGPRMELRCIKIEEGLGGGSATDPTHGLRRAVAQDLKAAHDEE